MVTSRFQLKTLAILTESVHLFCFYFPILVKTIKGLAKLQVFASHLPRGFVYSRNAVARKEEVFVVTHKILLNFCATPPRVVTLRLAQSRKPAFSRLFCLCARVRVRT